ncbi:MAG TPA: hypothetical protein VFO10_23440 [Oligoflexus sp.]|uniref:hypothetical protein n=1 Tax=Oligoflexus sp. TaxID=1971216 RepID=UPI002D80789A|nr:hypothetical protein [Oligoflexus sp.]HET9240237.1 hypothetical protein [Oligoflexus sp.]
MKTWVRLFASVLIIGTSVAQAETPELSIEQSWVEGIGGNCAGLRANLVPAEADFREGLCQYHSDSRPSAADEVTARVERWQRLQNQGLDAPRQVVASLMEGLAHCQRARLALPQINRDVSERAAFCQARENGLASLRSIRWEYARVNYAADTGRDVTQLIEEVASCQDVTQGPLNSRFNSICGIVEGVTAEREQAVVDATYAEVSRKYFGGTSPITQLLVEKKTMTEKVVEGMEGRVQAGEAKAAATAQAYQPARAYFDINVAPALDKVVEDYKWSYSTAKAILARYDEWQKGLLTDKDDKGNTVDLSNVLAGDAPTSLAKLLDSRIDDMGPITGYAGTIKLAGERMQKLQGLKAQNTQLARKMCAMYYCYIAVGPESDSFYKRACNTPALFSQQKNPLCENTKQKLVVDGTSQTAREFCAAYGFDVAKYGTVGLSFDQVSSCEIK